MIRCLLSQFGLEESSWCEVLPVVELTLNSAPQVSTGKSPTELVFGEGVRLPVDLLVQPIHVPAAADLAARVQRVVGEARQ